MCFPSSTVANFFLSTHFVFCFFFPFHLFAAKANLLYAMKLLFLPPRQPFCTLGNYSLLVDLHMYITLASGLLSCWGVCYLPLRPLSTSMHWHRVYVYVTRIPMLEVVEDL